MDFLDIRDVHYANADISDNYILTIQKTWRMYITRKCYQETNKRIQMEKKRTFKEINEMNEFVNSTKMDKHLFLKTAKSIIYKNFPGISLEPEKYFKNKFDTITIKAKHDSIGRTCPISIRQHSKNSIYFVLNTSNNSVSVKCFKCTGCIELSVDTTIFEDIKPKLTISEKDTKKTKTNKYQLLENLDEIKIVKFDHNVLHIDNEFILEFYDLNFFTQVAARLDKKCPFSSKWTTRTFEMNERINFKYNNLAIVCGVVSNIFVVDIDKQDDGLIYWQQLCTKHNYRYDKETTCVLTPSGGIHLYYKYNEMFCNNSVKMKSVDGKPIGIDIRSNGGVVIAPPSSYEKGSYKFLCMKRPQECPNFLYELMSTS